jgi:O-antigen/teichoic acid export membrane protein
MNNNQSSYRQILKATSIFGGVQIFQIIVQILRSKSIAILLGPAGMGIAGLLNSSISLVTGLTNFGLGSSAVKDIANAHGSSDVLRISTISVVLRRLILITGLFGSLVTIIFSSWISEFTFGNRDFTIPFIWISVSVFFTQVSSGQVVLLQGMRKLEFLAKANLFGSFLGLFITIPIYYKYGTNGIVPSIIVSSIITLLFSWNYTRKLEIKPSYVTFRQTFSEGKSMLVFGLVISITTLFSTVVSYLVRVVINRSGGLADVGLYTAGFSIVTIYLGMIFNSMGTDYYPRLSEVSNDSIRTKEVINQQAEITILILAPLLIIFFVFIRLGVIILYSKSFLAITDMMLWAALGMFFKASTWPMGFLFLAKGESKVYFLNELTSNIYNLLLSILGYKLFGLTGLGLAFFGSYLLTLIQVILIMKIKHDFFFSKKFITIFLYQFTIALITLLLVLFVTSSVNYFLGLLLVCLSLWVSYKELDKRIGLKNLIKSIKVK